MNRTLACVLILIILPHFHSTQSLFERFRASINNVDALNQAETVKIVPGKTNNRFERLKVPFGAPLGPSLLAHPLLHGQGNYIFANWLAGARLTGEGEAAVTGLVTFQPLPYNNGIQVTLNATGLPAGRHSLHIHTYGDIMEGCTATGGQFPNNFLGNIEAKEDGTVSLAFLSVYITLFGFNGIVGRSFVIHVNPIDLNTAFNAEIFSSPLKGVPYSLAYQNEESALGDIISCGVISILNANTANPTVAPR